MENEVKQFVAEFTETKVENLSMSTLVNDELGVDGDDGDEFMEAFSKKFSVDLSPINEVYFGPEGVPFHWLLLWPYYLLKWCFGYRHKGYSPLPIFQLVKSAEAGKWVNM